MNRSKLFGLLTSMGLVVLAWYALGSLSSQRADRLAEEPGTATAAPTASLPGPPRPDPPHVAALLPAVVRDGAPGHPPLAASAANAAPMGPTRQAPPARPAADPPPRPTYTLRVFPLAPSDRPATAENGAGEMVPAERPVAIEIEASQPWRARALDPILSVDALRFRRYEFVSPNVLRFVAAEGGLVPEDAEVSIQYGKHESSKSIMRRAKESR
jgi:hypothetical protein